MRDDVVDAMICFLSLIKDLKKENLELKDFANKCCTSIGEQEETIFKAFTVVCSVLGLSVKYNPQNETHYLVYRTENGEKSIAITGYEHSVIDRGIKDVQCK